MSEEYGEQSTETLLTGGALRRRPRRRRSVYSRPINTTRLVLALACIAMLAGSAVYYHFYQTARYVVALNGKPLVAVRTREDANAAILLLKMKYARSVPQTVTFAQGALDVQPLTHSMRLSGRERAAAMLDRHVNVILVGEGIFINGVPTILCAGKAEALETLSLIQQRAAAQGGMPTFIERIVLAPYHIEIGQKNLIPVMTPEQAARELVHPPRRNYCTVKRGDSFYAIAMARGLTVEQIKQLNPGVDPGALQPGDQVRLPDTNAPLTVTLR